MPTVFSHPAVAVGLFPLFRDMARHKMVLFTGILLTVLPDLDVLGFRYGIPYADTFGHRGISHSIPFAVVISMLCAVVASRYYSCAVFRLWLYFFLCMVSHGLLDAMTSGGLGIAFFSPFDETRYFFSFRPIRVSTLSLSRFFNGQGIPVIISELKWIWLPAIALMLASFVFTVCLKRTRYQEND